MEVVRLGLDGIINKAAEMAVAFVENIKHIAESGHELERASLMTGLATQELQRYHVAAQLAGSSTERFDHSMMMFGRSMSMAKQGNKAQAEALRKVGIEGPRLAEALKHPGQALDMIADRIAGIHDASERMRLSRTIFGRGGAAMVPMLATGAAGIREMGDQAAVMTDGQIEASKELVIAQKELGAISGGVWKKAIYPLIPAIRDLVKQWVAWARANAALMKQGIVKMLGVALTVIKATSVALKAMLTVLTFAIDHWKELAFVIGVLLVAALAANNGMLALVAATYVGVALQAVGAAIASAAAWALAALPITAITVGLALLAIAFADIWSSVAKGRGFFFDMYQQWRKFLVEWILTRAPGWLITAINELLDGIDLVKQAWRVTAHFIGATWAAFSTWFVTANKQILASIETLLGPLERLMMAMHLLHGGAATPNGGAPGLGGAPGGLMNPRLAAAGRLGGWDTLAALAAGPRSSTLATGEAFTSAPAGKAAYITVPQYIIDMHVTQLPGESGKEFADRVTTIMKEHDAKKHEEAAAALPATE